MLLSSLQTGYAEIKICGNKMPTRCNRGFYCRASNNNCNKNTCHI